MDNIELKELIDGVNTRLDKIFELLGKHDDEVNNIKVQQATMIQQIKALEGQGGKTWGIVAIVFTAISFAIALIGAVVKGLIWNGWVENY